MNKENINNIEDHEFYIGWQPNAPTGLAKHSKKIVILLFSLVIIAGIGLSLSQKKFGTGNFEFGMLTTLKGVYFSQPVPRLKVINGKDIWGTPSYITIPLIGYGKFGAAGIIEDIEKSNRVSLTNKEITLKGTLLYNDGKLLMQVDAADKPLITIGKAAAGTLLPVKAALGEQTFHGEIVDPKCFFGVMKPGEGKPHKDCAIRCISGGMPPVLRVRNEKGEENYYLIVNENGTRMNDALKNFIAEPVTIRANAVKYDDWIVLYVHDNGIAHYSYLQQKYGNHVQYCQTSCSTRP